MTEESSDLSPSVYPTWCPKLWNNTLKAIFSLQLQDVMVWQVALMGTQRICAKSRDPQGLLKAFFWEIRGRSYLSFWNTALLTGIQYFSIKNRKSRREPVEKTTQIFRDGLIIIYCTISTVRSLKLVHGNTRNKICSAFLFALKMQSVGTRSFTEFYSHWWDMKQHVNFHSSFNTGMFSRIE